MRTPAVIMLFAIVTGLVGLAHGREAYTGPDDPLFQARHAHLMSLPEGTFSPLSGTHPYDVTQYTFDLFFDIPSYNLTGTVTIGATVDDDELSTMELDFVGLEIDSITRDGVPVDYVRDGAKLIIDLGTTFLHGQNFEVAVTYHGYPTNGLHFGSWITYSFTEPELSRYWYPCYDAPDDKAPSDMNATVPIGYICASNGLLTAVDTTVAGEDTTLTYHWTEPHPIATYLISVAICPYAIWSDWYYPSPTDSIEIINYIYPDDSAKSVVDFERTAEMMELFSGLYAPYPFDKYGHAEAPFGGAMEHQTCTTWGQRLITGDKYYEDIVAHELAHQWWGDLATLADWREIWLNEGFATYSEALWGEYIEGIEGRRQRLDVMAEYYFDEDAYRRFPIYDPEIMWGATVYEKGAWVLHMLRGVVGDSAFFRGLRSYAQEHAYGNVTIADFQSAIESQHGTSLAWFFQQWIFEAGYPEYACSCTVVEAHPDTHRLTARVRQVQENAPYFDMPMDIRIYTDAGDTTVTERIWGPYHTLTYTLNSPVDSVVLDPDGWILKKVTIIGGVEEGGNDTAVPARVQLFPCRPNPFVGTTHLRYAVPGSGHSTRVSLCVYDLAGRLVRTLWEGSQSPGYHSLNWDGRTNDGKIAPPGSYFARLVVGDQSRTQKMILVK
jgi:aminopeptidase N